MRNKSIDNAIAWLLLFAGPFVTIFLIMNGVTDPVNVTKMLVMVPIAFCLMGLVLTQWRDLRAKEVRIVSMVSGLVALALTTSVVFSSAPLPQLLFGNYGRNTGFITYLSLLFIFFSASLVRQRNFSRNLLRALMVAGVVNVLYCLITLTWKDPLPWNNTYKNILGTLGNPDFISAFLGIIFVVCMSWLVAKSSSWRLRLFSLVTGLLAIFEAKKSHAIQGLAVAAIGFAIVGFFFVRSWISNKLATIGYSIAVGIVGFMALLGALQKGPFTHFIYKTSVSLRGEYWAGAINTAKDHPIFGVGLDTYGDWYRFERRPSSIISPGPNTVVNTAHNVFLDILASGGLFLFATYLLLVALSVIAIIRVMRRKRQYDATFVALTAAWIGYQAQSAVSINQIGLAIWGWLLGGALVSYEICTRELQVNTQAIEPKKSKRRSNSVSSSMPASSVLFGAVGGLIGLLLVLPPFMADNHWYNALKSQKAEMIQKAALSWPMDPFRMANAANMFRENKLNNPALVVAREAVKFNPRSFDSWNILSSIETIPPSEKEDAIKHLRELDPLNPNLKNLK